MTSIRQATGLVLLSTSLTFTIRSPTHFLSKKTHIFLECPSNLLYASVDTSEFTFLLCLNISEPFEIRVCGYIIDSKEHIVIFRKTQNQTTILIKNIANVSYSMQSS